MLSEEETRYVCSLKPAGFVRAWEAAYRPKCIAGPWRLSRRLLLTGAIERGNHAGLIWGKRIGDAVLAYDVAVPFGVGTMRLWWYRRRVGTSGQDGYAA